MLALIAAQEAAVIASGHGSSLTSPVGTGTVDGFAAGMVLSGALFMLILAQRRAVRRPGRAGASAIPPGRPAQAPALDDALGQNLPQPLAAPAEVPTSAPAEAPAFASANVPVEAPAFAPATDAVLNVAFSDPAAGENQAGAIRDLSTHPYAGVSPYSSMNSSTEFMPLADAASEVLLQPGIRLEEWLEGQMRRPSLPRSGRAPEPEHEHDNDKVPAPIPAAVAAAEAATAVVPAAPEAVEEDDAAHHRRAPAYQSKHRLAGRSDSKPWSETHRRTARHAAASSARSGAMSRMFSLRQLRPVSAGD